MEEVKKAGIGIAITDDNRIEMIIRSGEEEDEDIIVIVSLEQALIIRNALTMAIETISQLSIRNQIIQ